MSWCWFWASQWSPSAGLPIPISCMSSPSCLYPRSHSVLGNSSNKSGCTPMLIIGWATMHSQDICSFSFPWNRTAEHHRNVCWTGCLEAASSISHSKQVWHQWRPGQPWLWLAESWKTSKDGETATSLGYLCQCCTTFLREFLLMSSLILLSHKLFIFYAFFYHLPPLSRVWLYCLWNCPLGSCRLLLDCLLAFSLMDKKSPVSSTSLFTDPKTSALGLKTSW